MPPPATAPPIGTEAGQVEPTQPGPLDMPIATPLTPERAEAALVPGAHGPAPLLHPVQVRVQVVAVLALGAVAARADPLPAVGAGAQVPLVQEIARVALLAEPLEPVLAHQVVGAVR